MRHSLVGIASFIAFIGCGCGCGGGGGGGGSPEGGAAGQGGSTGSGGTGGMTVGDGSAGSGGRDAAATETQGTDVPRADVPAGSDAPAANEAAVGMEVAGTESAGQDMSAGWDFPGGGDDAFGGGGCTPGGTCATSGDTCLTACMFNNQLECTCDMMRWSCMAPKPCSSSDAGGGGGTDASGMCGPNGGACTSADQPCSRCEAMMGQYCYCAGTTWMCFPTGQSC